MCSIGICQQGWFARRHVCDLLIGLIVSDLTLLQEKLSADLYTSHNFYNQCIFIVLEYSHIKDLI